MERKVIVYCSVVGFLGLLSAAFGFAAEAMRMKDVDCKSSLVSKWFPKSQQAFLETLLEYFLQPAIQDKDISFLFERQQDEDLAMNNVLTYIFLAVKQISRMSFTGYPCSRFTRFWNRDKLLIPPRCKQVHEAQDHFPCVSSAVSATTLCKFNYPFKFCLDGIVPSSVYICMIPKRVRVWQQDVNRREGEAVSGGAVGSFPGEFQFCIFFY